MMDVPLLVPAVLRHAALYHGDTEVVSRTVEGPVHRTTYAETWRRCGLLANRSPRWGCGNPSGKGALYLEAQRICREASPAAARRMVELMDSDDERVALLAAERVLDRAWGRPREIPDVAMRDPVATERRETARQEVIRMLQALAVPEPLIESEDEADQGHR